MVRTKKKYIVKMFLFRLSRILLLVCLLVYWNIEPNSRASGNTWFTT